MKVYMWDKFNKKDIIYCIIILILGLSLIFTINKCSNIKYKYDSNITALTDSLVSSKTKSNKLIVSKKTSVGNSIKDIKQIDTSLYNSVKDSKVKNVTSATKFNGTANFGKKDTSYVIISKNEEIKKDFDFSNKWRQLSGNIYLIKDTLGLKIYKDKVNFEYTIIQDKNNNVYITSENPYVKYNQVGSFKIIPNKQKHWNIGPTIGYGYNFGTNKFAPYIGISLTYGIINF